MKLISICLSLVLVFPSILVAQKTETIYLTGTGAENTVNWDFYCSAGMNSGKWTTIAVPSCWEQQGFGSYNYGLDKFENRLNETGKYQYRFEVLREWSSKEVDLIFDGVMTDAEVKINGKLAGPIHQGAFYQFRYDVTNLLRPGAKNLLEVFVKKHSDNPSVNMAERYADYWVFGGIFRPVYLEVKPKTNIQRVAIDARSSGDFRADVYISNHLKANVLKVVVQSLDGNEQTSFEKKIDSDSIRIEGRMDNPRIWSPEFPNLYNVTFNLLDKNGIVIHQHDERIGFRTVEVRESDGIYVNGIRIKMKGVNRHTFHPLYGRTSSKGLSITDVNLMKEMNMNAVRMSHYPPDQHFLDVCDSLGMFVLDELASWQKPSLDDTVGRKLLYEMITRDVNHPSIILWDNGNEGGENNNLNTYFSELDIQRRAVLHPWQDYDRINTLHYIDYGYLASDGFSKRKIFFPTEFLHGLYDGGLGAGLDDFWFRMWNDPLCAGGFLWAFADEAVARTDRNGELDTDGNHAPDGIFGPYKEKEGSFFTIKEVWAPIYFEKRYITSEFNGKFRIENRYLFTNLDQCAFVANWMNFSNPNQRVEEKVEKTEHIEINLEPGQKGSLTVSLPPNWQTYDALRIDAIDRSGRHINTWSWPVKTAETKAKEILSEKQTGKPQLTETGSELKVEIGALKIDFDKTNGTILRIQKDTNSIPLSNGPVFVSSERTVKNVTHHVGQSGNIEIDVLFENGDSIKWTIDSSGFVHLDVVYEPTNNCQFAGITFQFSEKQVAGMKWLGDGPYRVYKNRMKGVSFGLWEKAYNNSITGESGYEYPEFKGYHSNIYWAKIQGKGVPGFTVFVKSNDIYLRMLTPDEPKIPAKTAMVYPSGGISFLHAISGIGTKMKEAQETGPQSIPYYFRSSRIHGGKLIMRLTFLF